MMTSELSLSLRVGVGGVKTEYLYIALFVLELIV